MAAQPQLPNVANIRTAVNDMIADGNAMSRAIDDHTDAINHYTEAINDYAGHQRDLINELVLFPNYPGAQQLAGIQQSLNLLSAQNQNLNAKIQNGQASHDAAILALMYSVDQSPNPQVPIGQAVLNFPATPGDISHLAVQPCHDLLQALGQQPPQGAAVEVLRTAVRAAIGLPSPLLRAELRNLRAQNQNGRVHLATEALAPMYSVDQGPNAQVRVGEPVQNFPTTPASVGQMTGIRCREILEALEVPVPQNATVPALRRVVRGAIGLSRISVDG